MGSEEYDWLRFVVGYTITRLGLLLALVLFGAFTGAVLFPSLVTFLPYSMVGVKNFFTQPDVKSLVGTVVICLFLIWVFFDDGKKHTAYEEWSLTTILAVLILVGMFYFIPAIFRDSFHAEGKGDIFYMVLYYPAGWLIDLFGDNYIIGIMFSILVMLGTAFAAYVISYKNYVKKHPVLLSSGGRSVTSDEDEDAGDDDTDE
ncbi:hypothetical protein RASY3_08450 [Ruminococcus albus SY3]|uniref:Uncharacterized protein n=1 Tax=Ruminococcus albus SY3 TaxID=1341156 RepID=A0A011WMK0_RUMAL|nr:hypothetical protein [Ruminococcus albus]EXM38265.1 hypothetical protein RASY3_18835 [Ruminococcus albus SY3]EXM39799.1 hypothetical protein RASY3_08450 [Ruminococcus albus SY3]